MTTATGFSAILGQASPVRRLRRFVRSGAFPHALLFTGNIGIGKKMAAKALAMACNCLTLNVGRNQVDSGVPGSDMPDADTIDACGECVSCRKIAGGHHPDIISIVPRSSVIRIDQIRSLLQTLALKPHEAKWRVVVFSDAQAMNPEAGNALLKILEEPPPQTLIILTTVEPADLLPTIISRSQQIRFAPLDAETIKHLLITKDGLDPENAASVASLCGGSYTQAQKMMDNGWRCHREWVIRAMGSLTGHTATDIRAWLVFSEMLATQKDRIEDLLDTMVLWLRDLMVVGIDPARVLSQDRLPQCRQDARDVHLEYRLRQIDAVVEAKSALRANTNLRLTLDAMVLKMAGMGNPPETEYTS